MLDTDFRMFFCFIFFVQLAELDNCCGGLGGESNKLIGSRSLHLYQYLPSLFIVLPSTSACDRDGEIGKSEVCSERNCRKRRKTRDRKEGGEESKGGEREWELWGLCKGEEERRGNGRRGGGREEKRLICTY